MKALSGFCLVLVCVLTCGLILAFALPHPGTTDRPRNFQEATSNLCQRLETSLSGLFSMAQKNPTNEMAAYSADNPITNMVPEKTVSANTAPAPSTDCSDSSITQARTVSGSHSSHGSYPAPSFCSSRTNAIAPAHVSKGFHAAK
jgi:hypothetical protein